MQGTSSQGNVSYSQANKPHSELGKIRITNAISPGQYINVVIDGKLKVKNLAYKSASVFITIDPGLRLIEITNTTVHTKLFEGKFDVESNSNYLLLIYKSIDGKVEAKYYNNSKKCAENRHSKVRYIHGSPLIPPTNLLLQDKPAHESIGFGDRAKYISIESGNYVMSTVPVGGTKSIIPSSNAAFNSGSVYTIILVGTPSDAGLILLDDIDGQCVS